MDGSLEAALSRAFERHMPAEASRASETLARFIEEKSGRPVWLKRNFSRLLEAAVSKADSAYANGERNSNVNAIVDAFLPLVRKDGNPEETLRSVGENFPALQQFSLIRNANRTAHAHDAFVSALQILFEKIGYKFSDRPEVVGHPEIVLPSVDHFRRDPQDAIFLAAAKSFRERAREIVAEGWRGFFLASLDEEISEGDLTILRSNRIVLIIPQRIKARSKLINDSRCVISFEDFFEDYLDPAVRRWRKNRVI